MQNSCTYTGTSRAVRATIFSYTLLTQGTGLSSDAVRYFAAQEIACFVQGPYRLIIFERSPETTNTKPSHPFSLGTYLMLYCHQHLDFPCIAFPWKFSTQNV